MSSHHDPLASHGRGGAGNIAPDPNVYVDGEITREGPEGNQGDGAYSTGRGGVGNIDSPRVKATNKQPGDTDVIPETAFRPAGEGTGYENYHTGRGGEGNIHKEKEGKESLVDKVKDKIGVGNHKDGEK